VFKGDQVSAEDAEAQCDIYLPQTREQQQTHWVIFNGREIEATRVIADWHGLAATFPWRCETTRKIRPLYISVEKPPPPTKRER